MAVEHIIVSGAWSWLAPEGEAFPDPDTVGVGDDWGGNWDWLGLTTEPLVENVETETFEVDVQQMNVPVLSSITSETYTYTTTLAENRPDLRQYLDGGNIYTTAPGVGQVGIDELRAGGRTQRAVYTIGFEARRALPDGTLVPVRLFFHRATIARGGGAGFDKAGVAGLPIQITALGDDSQPTDEKLYVYQYVTAPASS